MRIAKIAALATARVISTIGPAPAASGELVPPTSGAMVGSSTSTTTASRSSTISQPTAICPCNVSCSFRSASRRNSTTVLAIESANPRTSPPPTPQPSVAPSHRPSATPTIVWMSAPGMAIERTARRSRIEKWIPTPNISRITPTSASWVAISTSAMRPGVNGPIATPARM
jgi:hypothetical protein